MSKEKEGRAEKESVRATGAKKKREEGKKRCTKWTREAVREEKVATKGGKIGEKDGETQQGGGKRSSRRRKSYRKKRRRRRKAGGKRERRRRQEKESEKREEKKGKEKVLGLFYIQGFMLGLSFWLEAKY